MDPTPQSLCVPDSSDEKIIVLYEASHRSPHSNAPAKRGRGMKLTTLTQHERLRTRIGRVLDSTRENRRQEEFNNRVAQVKRPGDRRSVEWLCRRGGRGVRVCWPAGAGGWGGGGSGYWRAGRTAVCGRRERAAQPEPLWG